MRAAGPGERVRKIDRQWIGAKQHRAQDRSDDDRGNDSHSNSQ
jgi:hypothetical protein